MHSLSDQGKFASIILASCCLSFEDEVVVCCLKYFKPWKQRDSLSISESLSGSFVQCKGQVEE